MITLEERVKLESLFRACSLAQDLQSRSLHGWTNKTPEEVTADNVKAINNLNEFLDSITKKQRVKKCPSTKMTSNDAEAEPADAATQQATVNSN